MEFVTGKPSCATKTMPDGTVVKDKPSYACYFFTFLTVISYINLVKRHAEEERYAMAVLQGLVGTVCAYLLYSHCNNCKGWVGFLKTVAIGMVVTIGVGSKASSTPGPAVGRKPGVGSTRERKNYVQPLPTPPTRGVQPLPSPPTRGVQPLPTPPGKPVQ